MQVERVRAIGRRWAQSLAAVATGAALLFLFAPGARAVVVHAANGQFYGITPHAGVNPASIPGSVAAGSAKRGANPRPSSDRAKAFSSHGKLDYNGGPVLHSSAPYLIFWDPANGITANSRTVMRRYFVDLAADSGKATNVFSVNRQFTDGIGFADYKQTFNPATQVIDDSHPFPATGNCTQTTAAEPICLTDAQLQGEITRLITTQGLPTGIGSNAPIYLVVLPGNVDQCAPGNIVCADVTSSEFCAYHSSFNESGNTVLYASIPTLIVNGAHDPKGCQFDGAPVAQKPNGDGADVVIKSLSHETSETITDPLGNAWWDTATGNEDGDTCNSYNPTVDVANGGNPNAFTPTLGGSAPAGSLYNQLINGNPYYTQSEWSNGDVNCKLAPTASVLNPSFTTSATSPGAPVTLDPSASVSTAGFSSATWNFGDGSPAVFSPLSGAPATASHAYGALGTYAVTLTLVDTLGNLSTTTRNVTVGSLPVSSFTASPSTPTPGVPVGFNGGSSSNPDSGFSVTSYSWDFGDGSAAGAGAATSHAYGALGTYTVRLTVTNSLGLTASSSQQVLVDELPTAKFSVLTAHPGSGSPIAFTGSGSLDPDGSIRSYSWRFGDGSSTGSGSHARHTYARPGTYAVTLTVVDSSGFSTAVTHKIIVPRPGKVTRVYTTKNSKGTFLMINLNGPGTLTINGQRLRIRKAYTAKVKLSLSRALIAKLRTAGHVKLKVAVKFDPAAGVTSAHTYTLTITITIKR